jgi:hypothetical protein
MDRHGHGHVESTEPNCKPRHELIMMNLLNLLNLRKEFAAIVIQEKLKLLADHVIMIT